VTKQSSPPAGGHLRYYEQHGISPVRYEIADLDAHFDRRDSLYRSLGLPPAAFRGVRVLEVAPGSGQNSLYVAACGPQSLDLVEPNPAARRDIEAAYTGFERSHTVPTLHAERLEAFEPPATFDAVLCENWLGSLPYEVDLIGKIATLVAPGGLLVLTIVPFSGFFPNVMRRLLALRLIDPAMDFEEQTDHLVDIFGPHLASIKDMTRSHRDWVQDCLLNPHYLNVALPLDRVLEAIGDEMEVLATLPCFTPEWRWFKGLTGSNRRFNELTNEAFRENTHNFVDYRETFAPREAEANEPLDAAFRAVHEAAFAWQAAYEDGASQQMVAANDQIGDLLHDINTGLAEIDSGLAEAINELLSVWSRPELEPATVRDMQAFGALFGRETVYVSFTRRNRE